MTGNPAANDAFTIFLPKEVTPASVTSDVTLTVKIVAALSGGAVTANLIEIVDSVDPVDIATRIQTALNDNTAAGAEKTSAGAYKFSNLSVKLSEVFSVANGSDGAGTSKKTVTLVSTRKEGNEVVLTQTVGGTDLLGAASKTLSGAHLATPVIRGVLMSPQGVRPAMDIVNTNLGAGAGGLDKLVSSTEATAEQIKSEVGTKNFGTKFL